MSGLPIRLSINGQSAKFGQPLESAFGSQLRKLTLFPADIGEQQTARLEEEMRAAIKREMPEVAQAFDLTVTVMQDEITVALTSRSAVDQLAELERE